MTLSPIHTQNQEHHRGPKRAGSSWKIVQAQQRAKQGTKYSLKTNVVYTQVQHQKGRRKGACCSGHKSQSPDEASAAENQAGIICQYLGAPWVPLLPQVQALLLWGLCLCCLSPPHLPNSLSIFLQIVALVSPPSGSLP